LKKSALVAAILSVLVIPLLVIGLEHKEDVRQSQSIPATNPYLDKFLREYQQFLEESLVETGVPGAAVAIVMDSTVVFLKGHGVRSTETNDSVDINTVFRLGSVSKGFASVLTGIAVQDSLLHWDDGVVQYLPEFALHSKEQTNHLTIRHVLSHTTGLPYHTYTNLVESGKDLETLLGRLESVQPIAKEGEVYSYQNVAYSLIAEVLRAATGKSYDQLMQERLFTPLHMNSASVTYTGINENPNTALPHVYHRGGWTPVKITNRYYNVAPAGGVNASIADMAEWLHALLGFREDIISRNTLDEIFHPVIRTPARRYFSRWPRGKKAFYAMGWRVLQYGEDTVVYHGGSVNGYRSEIALNRTRKMGICVLTNASSGFASQTIPEFFELYGASADSIQYWKERNNNEVIVSSEADTVQYASLDIRGSGKEVNKSYYANGRPFSGFAVEDFQSPAGKFIYEISNGKLQRQVGYFVNGKLSRDFPFHDGRENGTLLMFHDNGRKYIEEEFREGIPHGTFRRWDSSGNLVEEKTFVEGTLIEQTAADK